MTNYNKVEWINGETPLSAENLNIMDDGIFNLADVINKAEISKLVINIGAQNKVEFGPTEGAIKTVNVPLASDVSFGISKIYVSSDNYLCIDTIDRSSDPNLQTSLDFGEN